ncbi:MAG: hypothetical protein ACK4MV_10105 [Beijerinckiaceae bacterium]
MFRLVFLLVMASGAASAQTINMDQRYFDDVARQNAARDAARAQEKQAETLRQMERNQRDRARQLGRQERNRRR